MDEEYVNVESLNDNEKINDSYSEEQQSNGNTEISKNIPKENKIRHIRLPMSRIKTIMRSDPDCNIISQDAVYLVTKATEMFIEFLGKEAAKTTINTKRKTVMKRDVDSAIDQVSHLCFLEGALEWQ